MSAVLIGWVLILGVISCHSQEPAAVKKDAYKLLRETPHRVTMTVEMRASADLAWEPYSSQTREVQGPNRWHLVQHTGLKLELVGIDDRTYQKMADGSWQLRPSGGGYTGPTVTQVSAGTGFGSVHSKSDGTSTVVESREHSTLRVNQTGEVVNMDRKTREWFDDTGRLTRVETEHFNFERKKFQRMTEVYEYDPTIKIEAPIGDK